MRQTQIHKHKDHHKHAARPENPDRRNPALLIQPLELEPHVLPLTQLTDDQLIIP